MTENDLDSIESHLGLGPDGDCFVGHCVSDRERLIAEVRRLTAGIRTKVEWWDRVEPDAMAYRVTADFRALIGDDSE